MFALFLFFEREECSCESIPVPKGERVRDTTPKSDEKGFLENSEGLDDPMG